ncbi:hypothetical protein HMPREF1981_03596 [Bacteroides pyogenes F0041]|uniref:Uncharacterized protein n=1 Tax=Bacteroides pyogenes F0041 TaxID=1321819 RepID=U2C9W5_9BACE|nr:hypothetical protein HMPREF1981_03596 [Bacteroides pyogenes F0041]
MAFEMKLSAKNHSNTYVVVILPITSKMKRGQRRLAKTNMSRHGK